MRHVFLLLLGLAIGIIGTVNILNALRQRDAYPRGLMDVLQHHTTSLRNQVRTGKCNAGEPDRSLDALKRMSADIETSIYPDTIADAPFREYAQRLQATLQSAKEPIISCEALASTLDKVGAACEACHHQYR